MKLNSLSNSFSGRLYLQHPQKWTPGIVKSIVENESIQRKLEQGYDITGRIKTKTEDEIPEEPCYHSKGDTLYKIDLLLQKEPSNPIEFIKNQFGQYYKDYIINQRYHSEHTAIRRIEELKMR